MYEDDQALLELNPKAEGYPAPCFKPKTIGSLVLAVAVIAWCNPFVGGAANHVVCDNAISSTSVPGICYGSRTVYASAGQRIELSCATTVERGHLTIYVWRHHLMPRLGESPLKTLRVHRSGTETCRVAISDSGLYRISIVPGRDPNGYDIDYDISWRVR